MVQEARRKEDDKYFTFLMAGLSTISRLVPPRESLILVVAASTEAISSSVTVRSTGVVEAWTGVLGGLTLTRGMSSPLFSGVVLLVLASSFTVLDGDFFSVDCRAPMVTRV